MTREKPIFQDHDDDGGGGGGVGEDDDANNFSDCLNQSHSILPV